MPYARPTLSTLIAQAQQDFAAAQITDETGDVIDGFLPVGVIAALSMVLPGEAYEHYGFLDWISKQAIPWTATDEFLSGWAALKGITQKPATATTATVTFSGTNGTSVPSGTAITRSDGTAYTSTASETVSAGTVSVPIAAVTAGAAGNFTNGATFYLANPIAGIQAQSTGSTQVIAGADQEKTDAFRSRMLQAYAAPPQGGDRSDYIEWATAVPGVTRAWIAPNAAGAGTVSVYFMMDVAESAHNGFPQGTNGVAAAETRDTPATGDQLTLANAIYAKQPVTALVYALAPTASPVAFTISDLGANNTTAMQTAIAAALADMFVRLANVGGTVNPQTGTAWPAIEPSDWYAALEAIPGLDEFKIPTPSASITPGTGLLFTVGALTFNT